MIKTKKWLLFTVSVLCLFVALLALAFTGSTVAHAATQNAMRMSDGSTLETDLVWTYGTGINYSAYRPEHGDTVFYTLSKDGEEQDKFAVKYLYTGDAENSYAEVFYEVKDNGEVDTETTSKLNSLNAYFKTLKTGEYTLTVTVPAGDASDPHTHWWDGSSSDANCETTYSDITEPVSLKVNAYEITASNVGASTSTDPNVTVKYTVREPGVVYTGEANNLPAVVELTLEEGGETLNLVEGEDYKLSSDTVNVGPASLTIEGIGGFTGKVTVENAYTITQGDNDVEDADVVRWKYGEYDRNINLFTANVKWGAEDLYFAIGTDTTGENFVEGLEEIRLTDGIVSEEVEQLLNGLDAKKTYYVYAIVEGSDNDNYSVAQDYTPFTVFEVTNTWTTTPNVVSWEWHVFDENVNIVSAVPAFGDNVQFKIYEKSGTNYIPLKFGTKDSFALEYDETNGQKLPADVVEVLAELDAGTYYLFASVKSNTVNYTSINEDFSVDALVPFRVFQARNYWTQIPELSNWSYGGYDEKVNVVMATSAYGSETIQYSIYQKTGDSIGILDFSGTKTFTLNEEGALPAEVTEGLKALHVGKYYLRAQVEATNNYTGLQESLTDFAELTSFDVIKTENHWSTAPTINTWAEGDYSNDDNLPLAVAHYGQARIVITDVDDEENVVYDSENNINKLAEAGVGAYLLTATIDGTDDYTGLKYDTIFHIFVPETAKVGIPWWLVLIIVLCSLAVLVFIFWLLHEKGVLQMLTGKMIVAMRTKATMDATIASVRANKLAREARERAGITEEPVVMAAPVEEVAEPVEEPVNLEETQVETEEIEDIDLDEDGPILISHDVVTGFATFARYQKTFQAKLIQSSDEVKGYYAYLKNVLLSYKKVKSKISKSYEAFNKGRIKLAKITIRGKTLCLYLALNPDDYAETKYKVERSASKKYADVPCLYRIKSARRLKYAEELIAQMCEQLGIEQGEKQDIDYRVPYETTEALIEKGLIKELVYQKKIGDGNDGTEEEDKPTDETELEQEIAAAEPEVEEEPEEVTEEPVEEAIEPETAEETEEDGELLEEDGEPILISHDVVTGFATFARYQKTFQAKLIQSSDEVKGYYSYLKNVLLSYKKVKSKISKSYEAFNKGRIKLAKMTLRGKTLCLYLALNPDDYEGTKYKVERSASKKYAAVPCLYRIKNSRRLKYAEELIAQMCEQLGIEQGERQDIDYRVPYETTEALIEKGLIKELVYQKKIDSGNDGTEEEDKPTDETELEQEIAVAEPEVEEEPEEVTEETVEEVTEPEVEEEPEEVAEEPVEEVAEPEVEEKPEEVTEEPVEEVTEPEVEEEPEEVTEEPVEEVAEPEAEEEPEEVAEEPVEEVTEPEVEEVFEEESEEPIEEIFEPEAEEEPEVEEVLEEVAEEPVEEIFEPEAEEEPEVEPGEVVKPVKKQPKQTGPKKDKNWRNRKFMKMPKLTPQEKARAKRSKRK